MTNKTYWEILEKKAENGMSILKIVIEGKEVYSKQSGSLRWLSNHAKIMFPLMYNKFNSEGWTMA